MSALEPIETAEQSLRRRQDELRDSIDQAMWTCAITANVARSFIEIGDDAGLEYAMRCLGARVRDAVKGLAALKNTKTVEVPSDG